QRYLLLGKTDAGNMFCPCDPGQIKSESAPTAANIQNMLSGGNQKLSSDMPLLGEVRFFKRCRCARKIRTRILPIFIEEQRIESFINIVMMRNVSSRSRSVVALLESAFCQA